MTDVARDLAAWLLERIAEDEAAAKAASVGPWTERLGYISGGPNEAVVVCQQAQGWNAAHIARWDPARVLAECQAKRRIVEWEKNKLLLYRIINSAHSYVLRGLAVPYADEPGYRQEWTP